MRVIAHGVDANDYSYARLVLLNHWNVIINNSWRHFGRHKLGSATSGKEKTSVILLTVHAEDEKNVERFSIIAIDYLLI